MGRQREVIRSLQGKYRKWRPSFLSQPIYIWFRPNNAPDTVIKQAKWHLSLRNIDCSNLENNQRSISSIAAAAREFSFRCYFFFSQLKCYSLTLCTDMTLCIIEKSNFRMYEQNSSEIKHTACKMNRFFPEQVLVLEVITDILTAICIFERSPYCFVKKFHDSFEQL